MVGIMQNEQTLSTCPDAGFETQKANGAASPPSPKRKPSQSFSMHEICRRQNTTEPLLIPWPQRKEPETSWTAPDPVWTSYCHGLVEEVSREVETYFLDNWKFPNENSKQTFLKAGFSRVTCLYFPLANDQRIYFACCLLTLLFLIDGEKYEGCGDGIDWLANSVELRSS